MNKCEIYNKLETDINKNKGSSFIEAIKVLFFTLFSFQVVLTFIYAFWYFTMGADTLSELGYTFSDAFWHRDMKGNPLFSLFGLNFLVACFFYGTLLFKFREKTTKYFENQDGSEFFYVSLTVFPIISAFTSIHLATGLMFLGFFGGVLFLSTLFGFFLKTERTNTDMKTLKNKTYKSILKDINMLRFLDQNKDKYKYKTLYDKVSKELIERERDLHFKRHCNYDENSVENQLNKEIGIEND